MALQTDAFEIDHGSAKDRASELLRHILPLEALHEYLETGVVRVRGRSGMTYEISPYSQTEIHDSRRKPKAYACLQLSIPAPTYDRMIAEYLLLRNDEPRYWKTANVFRHTEQLNVGRLFMIAFVTALAVNFVLQLVSVWK